MELNELKIGKTVIITKRSRCYDFYCDMAIRLNVKNWKKGVLPTKNEIYIIKNYDFHPNKKNEVVVYIENNKKEGFLFSHKGLASAEIFIDNNEFKI
jgi:hypothetical protein